MKVSYVCDMNEFRLYRINNRYIGLKECDKDVYYPLNLFESETPQKLELVDAEPENEEFSIVMITTDNFAIDLVGMELAYQMQLATKKPPLIDPYDPKTKIRIEKNEKGFQLNKV
jgi:hypothetical protein